MKYDMVFYELDKEDDLKFMITNINSRAQDDWRIHTLQELRGTGFVVLFEKERSAQSTYPR